MRVMRAPYALLTTLNAGLATVATAWAQPAVTDRVALPGFAIDRTEVTIAQFERFARATGTVTEAERSGGGFEYVGGW